MSKKQKATILFAGGAVVLLVIVGILARERGQRALQEDREIQKAEEEKRKKGEGTSVEDIIKKEQSLYTPEVPQDAVLTPPKIEVKNQDAGGTRVGVYAVTATRAGYTPATLTVKQGDVVNLEFTSQGGDFDLHSPFYGFYISAKDKETKQISFRAAQSGTYAIECRDYCPLGGKLRGQLVITP